MTSDYLMGHLYALGRGPKSIRFAKVLAAGPTVVYVQPFAQPPKLTWELRPAVPILSAQAEPGDQEAGPGIRILKLASEEFASWIPVHVIPEGRTWEEGQALDRMVLEEVPLISDTLLAQLVEVEPSRDGRLEYRPCQVHLKDGQVQDRVYVVQAEPFIQLWESWPHVESPERALSIDHVAHIEESPSRLPVALANKMYEAGESAMGGCFFTLVLSDGRHVPCATGNAVDFVQLPDSVIPSMIVDLLPHEGRGGLSPERGRPPGEAGPAPGINYRWCLYRLPR